MKARLILLSLCAVVCGGLLVGCGGNADADKDKTPTKDGGDKKTDDKKGGDTK